MSPPSPARQKLLSSKVRAAAVLLVALGLLHAAAGAAAVAGISDLDHFGMDWKFGILGVMYVVLAYFTWRRSRTALIVATGLFGGHAALLAAQLVSGDVKMPVSGILIRMLLVIPLLEGVGALGELERVGHPPAELPDAASGSR